MLIRGPAERGFTSNLLSDRFTRQVPISGLVPLNLACGNSLRLYVIWYEKELTSRKKIYIELLASASISWLTHCLDKSVQLLSRLVVALTTVRMEKVCNKNLEAWLRSAIEGKGQHRKTLFLTSISPIIRSVCSRVFQGSRDHPITFFGFHQACHDVYWWCSVEKYLKPESFYKYYVMLFRWYLRVQFYWQQCLTEGRVCKIDSH